ncbi:putative transposase [Nitrosovibrio tenuis]|uniref:Putative transposase n=1 Tax=Nitrosovibrio tenuis TaxID=1233 RepID=A0A1H7R0S1_9PROT|nr:putative transposase [Nitrosovibrio tenuis]
MIERCRDAFPIRLMCRYLHVSSSGYYDWRARPLSHGAEDNQRLLERIKRIHDGSDGVMGSPRVWEELRMQASRVAAIV